MCLIHIKVQSIIHMTFYISCCCCHKCNHNALMKEARGQNKLVKKASLLMCCCSFAIGQFLILKISLKDRLLNCCLKFKSAWMTLRVKHIRVVLLRTYPFFELYNAFNGISHKKLFAVFLPNRWEFLFDYLVTYLGQKSQQIAGKNSNAI